MPRNIELWEQAISAPTLAYEKMLETERQFLLDNIPNNAGVLDVGCGDGRNIRTILERTDKVVGLDKDSVAVQNATKKLEQFPNIKIVNADAVSMPFDNSSFDVVTVIGLMENLDNDKVNVLKECARVLSENGKVMIMAYNEDAFEERMKIYKQINAPIKSIEGTKVIFDESLGANISEQFSQEQISEIAKATGLQLVSCEKQGIVNICTLTKK